MEVGSAQAHCVRWGPNSPQKGPSPQFLAHVRCGQTAGWIKMPLSTEVGLGHSCSMGTQLLLHKGAQLPIFSQCLLWPNGWMDQDAIWWGGRPRPRQHVRWGPRSPSPKRGHSSPQFLAHVFCGQTARWIKTPLGTEVSLGPGHTVR